ncbi:MAG: primosomal protein N' [Candidatus Marinimicrobia bacterium]|nr:primosomal protein N' [Candidatus Neomarinimicrobiota bacterium]
MYAQVVLPLSRYQSFSYKVPENLAGALRIGCFVSVPFRKSAAVGVVVELPPAAPYKGALKSITGIKDDPASLPPDLWATLQWISDYYMTPLGLVLKAALPLGFSDAAGPREQLMVSITPEGKEALDGWSRQAPVQEAILRSLAEADGPLAVAQLQRSFSSAPAAAKRLAEEGLLRRSMEPLAANPLDPKRLRSPEPVTLTDEQTTALAALSESILSGKFAPFLLKGVTSSGKTEVYLQAARETLRAGRSVLVLVPEISLTPQVADRFHSAFGAQVALWHSGMSAAEKAWTWQQLQQGQFRVVVGARSAVFAPLSNLGLIVVDEEQESSYKQDDPAPRYHARDVALIRGQHAGATVLLTTATPSIESYFNGISGRFQNLTLTRRYGGAHYPNVQLIDMRLERQQTDSYNIILSRILAAAIGVRLDRQEQIILLQNRRGFAPVCACSDCDFVSACPNCSVPLTYHKQGEQLRCHYCGHQAPGLEQCPECGSPHVLVHGVGTQQVEQELGRLFPQAKVCRMDADTTRARGAHSMLLSDFRDGRYDILLGTQMIAKGLDFDRVTLVGVINADTGLAFPDFRAGERTFQMVYQVCGRAGRRKEHPGEAIIQSSHPADPAIQAAARLDAHRFYNQALAERNELNYPPFSRQLRLLLQGADRDAVWKRAERLHQRLSPVPKGMTLLGPATAPFERLRGRWRAHLLIKSARELDPAANRLRQHVRVKLPQAWLEGSHKGVRLTLDMDPANLL